MISTLDISRSALVAQRTRLDVIAGNIANADVTQQENGAIVPYRRRYVSFATGDAQGGAGVHVQAIEEDPRPFKLRYDPGHPNADAAGYVRLPNVSITQEYVDALEASRAYEANASMMTVTREMIRQAIQLFA